MEKEKNVSTTHQDSMKSEESIKDPTAKEEEGPPAVEKTASELSLLVSDSTEPATKENTKIDILLKATGNAPIMKKKKWAVSQDQHMGWISEFMKKYLKLDANDRLFLYINQTFAPAPDQTMKNLYDCYGTDGKLIIHYCKSQAWG